MLSGSIHFGSFYDYCHSPVFRLRSLFHCDTLICLIMPLFWSKYSYIYIYLTINYVCSALLYRLTFICLAWHSSLFRTWSQALLPHGQRIPPGALNSSHTKWLSIFWMEDDFRRPHLYMCRLGKLSPASLMYHTQHHPAGVTSVPVLCRWMLKSARQVDLSLHLALWIWNSTSSSCPPFFFLIVWLTS